MYLLIREFKYSVTKTLIYSTNAKPTRNDMNDKNKQTAPTKTKGIIRVLYIRYQVTHFISMVLHSGTDLLWTP